MIRKQSPDTHRFLFGTILHFTSPLVLKEEIASTPPAQPITLWKRKVF